MIAENATPQTTSNAGRQEPVLIRLTDINAAPPAASANIRTQGTLARRCTVNALAPLNTTAPAIPKAKSIRYQGGANSRAPARTNTHGTSPASATTTITARIPIFRQRGNSTTENTT